LDPALLSHVIQALLGSKEFFINKPIGWVLREYRRTDPDWVVDFVERTELSNLNRREALKVLEGGTLNAKDALSFDHPPINSEEDWEQLLDKVWADAETFGSLIELLPDEKLSAIFEQEKYGNYYRNLGGISEHSHYHLGRIVLMKKLVKNQKG
jgi:hypothetical protein